MSKHKGKRKQTQSEEFDVKPDFAMDGFVEKKETKKAPVDKEAELNVKDRIGTASLSKLEKLRAEMKEAERVESEAAQTAQAKANGAKTTDKTIGKANGRTIGSSSTASESSGRSSTSSSDSTDNLSFAELFNPEPDDEADFDTMLQDSKLDWRQYK